MTVLTNTTGKAVVDSLSTVRGLQAGGTSGLALTLVVVADQSAANEALEAACVAAAAHPCRLLVVLREGSAEVPRAQRPTDYRLDAEISVDGHLGPGEVVILRMYGRLAFHAESVTLPLLAPDVPVVTWWHGPPPRKIARDPLGVFADRRLTDCSRSENPLRALAERATDYVPGDTDITWSRITPWRALVANAFDTIAGPARTARVFGSERDPSVVLLAGWLTNRLGIQTKIFSSSVRGDERHGEAEIDGVEFEFDGGQALTIQVAAPEASDGESTAVLIEQSGSPARRLPLRQPGLGEHLAEELRHLDPDQPYAAALSTATGIETSHSPGVRVHEWYDPAENGAS